MRMIIGAIICLMLIFSSGCGNKSAKHDASLSLMKYGIPVSLAVAADAEVITGNNTGKSVDVHVKHGEDFHMHIFQTEAVTNDISYLVQKQKEQVSSNPFFIKFVEEYPDGFIYEKYKADESGKCYDFKKIKLQGTQEIIFECAITFESDEKNIKRMYQSIL
ncbi:MAG: hypothetical protein IPM26_14205 [Saprospiraceae bacterium]|nr:hypothetical protein [Saprospiraceae bacterium]